MGSGTLVVSLRSRGLTSYNEATFNVRYQALMLALEAWDVIISVAVTLFHLSWTSWLSIVITILSVSISMGESGWLMESWAIDPSPGDVITADASVSVAFYLPFIGAMFMPMFALLAMVFWRREKALQALAKLKSHVVGLVLSASAGDAEGGEIVQKRAFVLLDDLHR